MSGEKIKQICKKICFYCNQVYIQSSHLKFLEIHHMELYITEAYTKITYCLIQNYKYLLKLIITYRLIKK